jgi:ribonuclease HI
MALKQKQKEQRLHERGGEFPALLTIRTCGAFFRKAVRPDWKGTITLRGKRPPNRDCALREVKKFLRDIERVAGLGIRWVIAEDYGELGRRLHFHILIGGVKHLRRKYWWMVAFERFGRCWLRDFNSAQGGAEYTAKNGLSDNGQFHFGGQAIDKDKTARWLRKYATQVGPKPDTCHLASVQADGKRTPARPLAIHIAGAGARADRSGSGYAYLVKGTSTRRVKRIDGLTNHQADYRALRYALRNIPKDFEADIFSHSKLMVCQFNGEWSVRDPELKRQLARVREIISDGRLLIRLFWIPREENLAGRLL